MRVWNRVHALPTVPQLDLVPSPRRKIHIYVALKRQGLDTVDFAEVRFIYDIYFNVFEDLLLCLRIEASSRQLLHRLKAQLLRGEVIIGVVFVVASLRRLFFIKFLPGHSGLRRET